MSVFDTLEERGYVEQVTHEKELRELLDKEQVTFYIGFDPTADSLHVGHFVQIMIMMHMQRAGHRPIAIVGGGTGMIGDPSGRTDMRTVMTNQTIIENCNKFKEQLSRFIDFGEDKAIMVNNADWLCNLNYIQFIREIGVHFSVNRMLTAECFKNRMEKGLSFFEFNYMLMQSYDFLELYRRYGCRLELGGNDQWSNIISGVDLVRRVEEAEVYGLTFKLLTTSEGIKMGKTQKGALWIDPNKTSPYEFYHYWRNIADADVENCLALLTFIPMDEVRTLGKLEGSEINKAKERLAYEITALVHSEEEAIKAAEAEKALFSKGADMSNVPSIEMSKDDFADGIDILSLFTKAEMIPSKSEGRRLLNQGGIYVNEEQIKDIGYTVDLQMFDDDKLLLRKGKKAYKQIKLV